jgi:hypothetical protein
MAGSTAISIEKYAIGYVLLFNFSGISDIKSNSLFLAYKDKNS